MKRYSTSLGYERTDRIGDLIRAEVAEILNRKIKDPRIGFVTVTGVDVTKDLREAKVFVSVFEEAEKQEITLKGLKSATRFIRGELGRRLQLRRVPQLSFFLDLSAEKAAHLYEILEKVKLEDDEY